MRLRNRNSTLLLLLLPSLALATTIADKHSERDSVAAPGGASPGRRYGTKDAPVDGNDGKPHAGPFVELDSNSAPARDLPALKDRPEDPLIVDGKRIPESHDGVMDDKNRPGPRKGTTGTEGGVSEKEKDRKMREKQTGEKVENKPPTPKEAPPLPDSDQERIQAADEAKSDERALADAPGLEKPADLPDKTHDRSPPLPDSAANIDHLDVSKGGKPGKITAPNDDDNEGLVQPLHSFMLSFTMIIVSEIGDKTFLVAALMAMKHDRLVVFSAALSALVAMTVLSAVLGHAVPTLIPKRMTTFLAAVLFFVFGARLLREGLAMSPDEGVSAEMQEVEMELAEKENLARKEGRRGSDMSPYALEMGLGNRKPRTKSRFPAPARSPSSSPEGRSPSPRPGGLGGVLSGLNNLVSLLLSPAWVQTFVMTFLGEWGDRSQIATIAMAAGQDYWWVTLGAVLGHACCTGVAVIGGRAIAGKVSLKVVTVGGAVAFLVFAVLYLFESLYS
jgi:putative Ca2+/H+ antiporter (TMEM165/GDT1 family)